MMIPITNLNVISLISVPRLSNVILGIFVWIGVGLFHHSLTMITSCIKVVNLNCVAISVALALSEQLLCNWCMALMCMIMICVRLGKDS
jgi:hypothetical protein